MKQYDVAVIGGGLIGCATAYELAKSGSRVVVIERGQVNQGASGQNAGSLHFQLEHRLIKHREQLPRELELYAALAKASIERWRNIERELGCELELAMDGGLMVAEAADEIALLEQKAAIENRQGLNVELLDRAAVRERAPYLSDTVQGALYCAQEGHCNPRLVTPAYVRGASAAGAEFMTQTRVTGLARHAGRWNLTVEQTGTDDATQTAQTLHSDVVVAAAGAWSAEIAALADLHMPLFAIGLTMNVTNRVAPQLPQLIQHAGRRLSMKQAYAGNVLIGGGWPARMRQRGGRWFVDAAPELSMRSVVENLRIAAAIVPAVREMSLLRSWTGTTAVTADHLPVLGEVPQVPGFYIAAGEAGFSFGPTFAALLSELILSGNTDWPIDAYSPARFDSVNMFMGNA